MKKLLLTATLVSQGYAMNNNNAPAPTTNDAAITDIVSKISSAIEQYESTNKQDDAAFQQLVQSYFEHESIIVERQITPQLAQLIQSNDSQIQQFLVTDDKAGLEKFMDSLMTQAVEKAFQNQQDQFQQLDQMAKDKLKKSYIALATAIVTGVLGVVGVFLGVYFGVK